MEKFIDAARHNCQTGGYDAVFFDSRRRDWFDWRCFAGGPLDAPSLLPKGSSWAVRIDGALIVSGYASRDGSPRPAER